jgi:hypothetical protein
VTAAAALQGAIHGALAGNATLTALLGGPRIHDRTPDNAVFPYVTFGASASLDWSTGSGRGSEELVLIEVWSRQPGRKQALDIANAVTVALDAANLNAGGHRVVLLRHAGMDVAFVPSLRGFRAALRFEALTEPV